MPLAKPEFAENLEPRCPFLAMLDVSASIAGRPLQELNSGLTTFMDVLRQDEIASLRVEPAIVTFGGNVKVRQDFASLDQVVVPHLRATGGTPMGEAIVTGLSLLEARKAEYKINSIEYFRPFAFLITDGAPTDDTRTAQQLIHDGEAAKRFSFFAVGVQGADMNMLGQIAPPNRPPVMLKGLDFTSMFLWLSGSIQSLANSAGSDQQVALKPVDGWTMATS